MQKTNIIDIHSVLAKRRQIGIVWSTEDVRVLRPDLTDNQAWKVLQEVDRRHDTNLGINWLTIEIVADELFSETDSEKE